MFKVNDMDEFFPILSDVVPDKKDIERASKKKTANQIDAQANAINDIDKCMRRGIAFVRQGYALSRDRTTWTSSRDGFWDRLKVLGATPEQMDEYKTEAIKSIKQYIIDNNITPAKLASPRVMIYIDINEISPKSTYEIISKKILMVLELYFHFTQIYCEENSLHFYTDMSQSQINEGLDLVKTTFINACKRNNITVTNENTKCYTQLVDGPKIPFNII